MAFDHMDRAALVVDPAGNVLVANRAARRVLSLEPDALPLPIERLFKGPRDQLLGDIVAAASGSRLTLLAAGAARRTPFGFRVSPIREDALVKGFVLIQTPEPAPWKTIADMSDQLREANARAAHERRAKLELKRHNRALENFSHAAAHDLKAPLRNISSVLDLLAEDYGKRLDDEALDYLSKASEGARRLQSLIAALLEHARSGDVAPKLGAECLDTAVAAVRADLDLLLEETGGTIIVGETLGEVEADRTMLGQLLQNLIGNAIKYRHPDRPPEIRIDRTHQTLIIRDNGRGFEPERADSLFEPFARLTVSSGIEGSGIGLATCRRICDRHGWTIEAEGRPGEGAIFTVGNLRVPVVPSVATPGPMD
ncbi:hypothetical protein F3S47_14320 [Histidinibacterium aquaticum]|uniref:histidine kinase n=1 Tax=Histidinibacterium aquaticum TaxID=2613962 RepID=A0A5J5GFN5_9RHOB|nr:hypothetical protein F3S47_14320 [Histidinibacterium aquaticum]